MITSTITEVVNAINSGSYSIPLTAVQRWTPETEKGDTETVCFVWCSDMSLSREDRCGLSMFDVNIKVGIRKPVDVGDVSAVNQVVEASEEVAKELLGASFNGGQAISSIDWVSPVEIDELYEDSVVISIFEIKLRGLN